MEKIKVCTKCGRGLPATNKYFDKGKNYKDGLRSRCKQCRAKYRQENKEQIAQYKKQYYQENKEKILDVNRSYYEDNKKQILEQVKKHAQENKEQIAQYKKEYYQRNKEEISIKSKNYYKENKEQILERCKQYYQENKEQRMLYKKENPEVFRQAEQRRQARKKRLPSTLTLQQWTSIKEDFNNQCAYCGMTEEEHLKQFGEQLHQEHFIPLSKGGGYTHNNIIPACKECNSSKHNADFFEWYPQHKYYSKERERKILEYLNYKDEGVQQLSILK